MKPVLGMDIASTPAKAAKKSAAKRSSSTGSADVDKHVQAEQNANDEVPSTPRKRAAKKTATKSVAPRKPVTVAALKRIAEQAVKRAKDAEHREKINNLKSDVKYQEQLVKEHTKGLAAAEKALAKAQERLDTMIGPGE